MLLNMKAIINKIIWKQTYSCFYYFLSFPSINIREKPDNLLSSIFLSEILEVGRQLLAIVGVGLIVRIERVGCFWASVFQFGAGSHARRFLDGLWTIFLVFFRLIRFVLVAVVLSLTLDCALLGYRWRLFFFTATGVAKWSAAHSLLVIIRARSV